MKIKNILMGSLAAAVGAAGIISASTATADEFPHDPKLNQASYWEGYFEVEGIQCTKVEDDYKGETYTVDTPGEGLEWYAVILKAGAKDGANKVYYDVEAGTVLTHPSDKNISHVIACTVPVADEPGDDDPEEPGEPTDPKDPEEPTDPKDPEEPKDPEDPKDPEKPGDDDKPEEPGKPGDDDKGDDDPSKPGDDDKGEDKPVKPTKPGKPGLPSTGR